MAHQVEVRNVNPRGSVRVFVDGEHVEVDAGKVIKVTPESAGSAPRWRRATEAEAELLQYTPEAMHTREHAGHLEVFDLGEGLLAQPENWRLAADDGPAPDPLAPGHPVSADDTTPKENG